MSNELILKGIDGANPLGFLAAVGVLRTATKVWPHEPGPCMGWVRHEGGWRPLLVFNSLIGRAKLTANLHQELQKKDNKQQFDIAEDLSISANVYRAVAMKATRVANPQNRCFADFMAAFGSEGMVDEKTGNIKDTAIRTMNGAGHQHFLGTMRQLVADTEENHIERTLFSEWLYDDPVEKHTLRWDPIDDVRYALRWQNPSGDRQRKMRGCVWGANRFAIEALPLFPTAITKTNLETTAFQQKKGHGVFFTWPIWTPLINIEVLRSLLALKELQRAAPCRNKFKEIGIVEVFRCQRLTQGKFRNFTPGYPV